MGAALSVMARSTSPEELARRIGPPSIDYDHTRDPLTERMRGYPYGWRRYRSRRTVMTCATGEHGDDPFENLAIRLMSVCRPRSCRAGRHAVDVTADTMEVFRTLGYGRSSFRCTVSQDRDESASRFTCGAIRMIGSARIDSYAEFQDIIKRYDGVVFSGAVARISWHHSFAVPADNRSIPLPWLRQRKTFIFPPTGSRRRLTRLTKVERSPKSDCGRSRNFD